MVQLHCWIILGRKKTRKGSLIRSLTGIPKKNHFDVMLSNGQWIRLWTAVMSANEPDDALPPDEWVAGCGPAPVPGPPAVVAARINILAAFRLDRGVAGHEAEDYLNALAHAGAVVEAIVTLGEVTRPWVPGYGAPSPYPECGRANK